MKIQLPHYEKEEIPGIDLYLFRHGCTRYNLEKRYQGCSDLPLIQDEYSRILPYRFEPDRGETGKRQENSPFFETADVLYVSPAVRARQTADLLFPGMQQTVVPEFREMDFGVFEGRSADEMACDPQYRSWIDSMCEDQVPGGESLHQFTARVCERFARLAVQAMEEGRRRLLIVAHGGTQMAVMSRFCPEDRPYWSWQTAPGEAVLGRITR